MILVIHKETADVVLVLNKCLVVLRESGPKRVKDIHLLVFVVPMLERSIAFVFDQFFLAKAQFVVYDKLHVISDWHIPMIILDL